MAREAKVGLLVGMGIILLIGIVVSDQLSVVQDQSPANLTQLAEDAQRSVDPTQQWPGQITDAGATDAVGETWPQRQQPIPTPSDLLQHTAQTARQVAPQLGTRSTMRIDTTQAVDTAPAERPQPAVRFDSPSAQPSRPSRPQRTADQRSQPSAEPRVHHVQPGETLWVIAERFFGDGGQWRRIQDANPKAVNADGSVRVGVRLVIPGQQQPAREMSLAELDQEFTPRESRASSTVAAIMSAADRVRGRDSGSATTVKVEPGDSLSKLADRHLGHAGRWRDLLEANKDRLDGPRDLRAGMTLRLPGANDDGNSAGPAGTRAYTVRPGDTLSSIARATTGSGDWRVIYEMNRKDIPNPSQLVVGQTLRVPAH